MSATSEYEKWFAGCYRDLYSNIYPQARNWSPPDSSKMELAPEMSPLLKGDVPDAG